MNYALVTGASRGIGCAIAIQFAKRIKDNINCNRKKEHPMHSNSAKLV